MKRKLLLLASLATLGLGGVVVLQPDWLLNLLGTATPNATYSVQTDQPLVALTIDDGPDACTTPRILDLLQRHAVRATFFVLTDNVVGNEQLLERMVQEGHELGNHLTDDHPSILLGAEGFQAAARQAHDLLARFAEVRWLRPGSGWYNGEMVSTAEALGYRLALGSIYPFDALLPSPWFASRYILWRARPGSIIVLHDVGSRGERTLATLEAALPELIHKGFQVVTLSELEGAAD